MKKDEENAIEINEEDNLESFTELSTTEETTENSLETNNSVEKATKVLPLLPTNELERLQLMINSKVLPSHVKTIEQAYAIAQYGKELGMKPMTAFHQIIMINGRLTLTAKALGGLLWANGISYRTLIDGELQIRTGATGIEVKDRTTSIEFTRNNVIEIATIYWSDMVKAGWTTKANWVKMPKYMLYARCLSMGANRIAPDIINGLYTTEEMADVYDDKTIHIDEDGNVTKK